MGRFFDAGQDAHGFIAVGQFATGFFALGQNALGVIAVGQLARGVIAVGQAAFGVVAIGMVAGGLFGAGGIVGIGGRKVFGFVIELLPKLPRRLELPHRTSLDAVWSSGEPGWIRAAITRAPGGTPALAGHGKPLPIKLTPALRLTAEKALSKRIGDVLAHTARHGEVLVCDRLMITSLDGGAKGAANYLLWAPRLVALIVLSAAYWLLVGFPLVQALVSLGD